MAVPMGECGAVYGAAGRAGNVALRAGNGYMRPEPISLDTIMRAETQKVVEDIKRSVGLLRRHL